MKTLHTAGTKKVHGFWQGNFGKGFCVVLLGGILLLGICGQAHAIAYDMGTLSFSTSNQSMWGTGEGFSIENSIFLGSEWTNKTASVGNIWGSSGGWVDTRTGFKADLTSSGKVGIEAGFKLDSGTVDATADFSAQVELPDNMTVNAGRFFTLNASSTFDDGAIETESPGIEAYLNGVMELSGSASTEGCMAFFGCASNTINLPTVNYHPEILGLNPNSGLSLFGESLGGAEGSITVTGDLPTRQVKVETSSGVVLKDYKTPATVETDLGEISYKLPEVSTEGSKTANTITSSGRDTVLGAKLDLDGMVAMATGFTPSAEFNLIDTKIGNEKFEVAASVDFIDIDVGPTMDFFQDFEILPKLMVDLQFSHAVDIQGYGRVTSYSGAWDSLPALALLETTTVTPTFWLNAMCRNTTGLDFGFELDLAALSASFTATLGDFEFPELAMGPIWEDTFGLGGRFGNFNLFDNSFALNGFNRIAGNAFTLFVSGSDFEPVPEPGTMLLIGIGLAMMVGMVRRSKNRLCI